MAADKPILSLQALAEIARHRERAYLKFVDALVPSPASWAAGYKPRKSHVTAAAESYALEIFNIEQEHYPRGDQDRLRPWLEGLSTSVQDEMVQLLYAGAISDSVPHLVMRTLYRDDELRRIVSDVVQNRIEEILGKPKRTENVMVPSEVDPAESGSNSPAVFVGHKSGAKLKKPGTAETEGSPSGGALSSSTIKDGCWTSSALKRYATDSE
jgi:hypothetical protein